MIYRRPPDSDWSFAPERGNKEIQGWEEKRKQLLNFLTLLTLILSQLFICVRLDVRSSPASSVAAGNPPQLCYQECLVRPYKGKLTRGLDTSEFKALIRSAAWLHSNLSLLWKLLLWPSFSCTNTQYPPPPASHSYPCTWTHTRTHFLAESIHTPLCRAMCSTRHSSQRGKR